jgi:hypothetical protein
VKPSPVAYAPPNVFRTFRVYLPKSYLLFGKEPLIRIELVNPSTKFELPNNSILLKQDKNHDYLFSGDFKIMGKSEGDQTNIQCEFDDLSDEVMFIVRQPGQKKTRKLTGNPSGTFTDIIFDERSDPSQRVSFNYGEIRIYTKFKPINQYLKSREDAFETQIGKVLTAELVAEAFTKKVARDQLERGDFVSSPENEIDNFNAAVNRLLQKYLKQIYDIFG